MILWTLFWQFTVISLLAFGGGQAALPLIERISVAEKHWIGVSTFTTGVALGYLAPGPVTILATFIGYQAAGFPGAGAATLGVFLAPVILAALAAAGVERFSQSRYLRAFGAGAAPAVVGLLVATAWNIGGHTLTSWPLCLVAVAALLLVLRSKVAPGFVLIGGAVAAWLVAALR